jgi:hypothetical protein
MFSQTIVLKADIRTNYSQRKKVTGLGK